MEIQPLASTRPVQPRRPVPSGEMAAMLDTLELAREGVLDPSPLQARPASAAVAKPGDFDPDVQTRPWQDDIIYMAMVDRFHNGDPSNDGPVDPSNPHARHGGDLRGMIQKLPYLKEIGVTALWIDPVEQNQDDGYHGYWPTDFTRVDPRRGTMEELKELREKANALGIKLILDRVTNHTGYQHVWPTQPEKQEWFHHSGDIKWMDQRSIERGSLHGLPDLAQENPEVADWLISNDLRWQKEVGAQAFRLDAVKHVPSEFWKDYSAALHEQGGPGFLLLGEVFRGIPDYLARYQREDGIDSVFDVPLADAIRNTLTRDSEEPKQGLLSRTREVIRDRKYLLWNEILRKLWPSDPGDMRNLAKVFAADSEYEHPELLATILDNHDVTRFVTEAGEKGPAKLRMAMALLMTARGMPVVLYGTEVGMEGRSGQGNRDDMPFGKNPEMLGFFQKLTALRRDTPALRRGKQVELHADKETYAFARTHERGNVLVALNNSRDPQQRALPARGLLPEGAVVEDVLTGARFACRDGVVDVVLDPSQALILRPVA